MNARKLSPLIVVQAAVVLSALAWVPDVATAGQAPGDFAGVQASFADVTRGADDPRSLARRGGSGIGLARVWVSWADVEVAPGRYTFDALDLLVERAARQGLRLLPVLVDPPSFRSSGPPGTDGYPPANPDDMARFASYLTGRYGSSGTFWQQHPSVPRVPIRSWQVWNEPNLWPWWSPAADAAGYVRLLRAVGGGIKRCDSGAEVVAAGLPNSHEWLGPQVAEYLDAMYRAGARGSFDTLAIHPYGSDTSRVMAQVEEARSIAARWGDAAPIWVTELGWGTGGPATSITVSEARQAELLRTTLGQLYARRDELRIRGFVYYQWADLDPGGSNEDSVWHHIGLIRSRGADKPALAAYVAAIRGMGLAPVVDRPAAALAPGCEPPAGAVLTASELAVIRAQAAATGDPGHGSGAATATGCKPTPRHPCHPELTRVRLRPARFRAARTGPPLRPGARCGPTTTCGRAGAQLTFRATRATVELRLARGRGKRARAVARPLRLRVRAGDTELRLLGRVGGRPLRPGIYTATLQLIDADARRSQPVSKRFTIVR